MEEQERREQEKPYQYWLMNIKGLGKKRKRKLLREFGSAEEIYRASEGVLRAAADGAAEKIFAAKKVWNILEEYEMLCRQKIKFTCWGDKDYPKRLEGIPDAPFCLYYWGSLPSDEKPAVALIGARACSGYGAYAAGEFGSKLAQMGIQIISGLAMGIDGISQEAALLSGGESFGVLGCGVDICYPAQNKGLYGRLLKGGAVLSSYPNGTPARPQNFPPRNRIVSGLADAVGVIEARAKSGTLITVDMALEQGREVYVVPGRVTDRLSDGCNRLIKQGAGMVLNPESFWEEILQIRENKKEQKNKKIITKKHFSDKPGNSGTYGTTSSWDEGICGKQTDKLPGELGEVYDVLDFYPRTVEEIAMALPEERRNMQIVPYLMQLCMEEKAIQVSPGHFCRKGTDKFPFPC